MESANLTWRKARASGSQGDCVQLAFDGNGRATGMVRDSKSPERGHLAVTTERLAAFIADAKEGKLDLTVLKLVGHDRGSVDRGRPPITRGIRYDGYSDCLGEGTCGGRYAS
jgi:uncharacterized protein DUF397